MFFRSVDQTGEQEQPPHQHLRQQQQQWPNNKHGRRRSPESSLDVYNRVRGLNEYDDALPNNNDDDDDGLPAPPPPLFSSLQRHPRHMWVANANHSPSLFERNELLSMTAVAKATSTVMDPLMSQAHQQEEQKLLNVVDVVDDDDDDDDDDDLCDLPSTPTSRRRFHLGVLNTTTPSSSVSALSSSSSSSFTPAAAASASSSSYATPSSSNYSAAYVMQTPPPASPAQSKPTPDWSVFESMDSFSEPSPLSLTRRVPPSTPARSHTDGAARHRRKSSLWERKNLFCFTDTSELFEDRFEFEPIGEGSFFHVFRAKRRVDGQMFAVKKSKRLFSSKSERRRYLREVISVSMLPPSPHIVEYHRAWQEDLHFFIKMELCRCTVREWAEELRARNEMNMSVVWKLLLEVCHGLEKVHSVDLLHLDIKPDNILVGQDSMFKLADFGQSVLRDSWEDGGEGDNRYMAPELLDIHLRADTSSDMFSVGCCILEVVTGFNLPSGGSHWHTIREGKYRSLLAEQYRHQMDTIDPLLLEVLDGLLREHSQERLTAANILVKYGHMHPTITTMGGATPKLMTS